MKEFFLDENKCCGCAACSQICPKGCIIIRENPSGFLMPSFDKTNCIDCGLCSNVCPIYNAERNTGVLPKHGYAYLNHSEEYRLRSASSGAFEDICRAFIGDNKDFSIYGCTMDESLKVKHCAVQEIEKIEIFKKSKYVQSKIEDTYKNVQHDLMEGKKVVFSGTPCQVMALNRYLRKDYLNLLTVDFVCHGVPSQSIFDRYISWIEKKYKSKVKRYSFRNKRLINGTWTNLGIKICFQNGKILERDANDDLYMIGFLKGLYMRDGCYSCKFASLYRVSDITIGDFWGVGEVYPELDESKTNGTSLLLVNTEKGERAVANIESTWLYAANIQDIAKNNGQLNGPQKMNCNRDVFFCYFNNHKPFEKCIKQALPEMFHFKIEKVYQLPIYIGLSRIKNMLLRR